MTLLLTLRQLICLTRYSILCISVVSASLDYLTQRRPKTTWKEVVDKDTVDVELVPADAVDHSRRKAEVMMRAMM